MEGEEEEEEEEGGETVAVVRLRQGRRGLI